MAVLHRPAIFVPNERNPEIPRIDGWRNVKTFGHDLETEEVVASGFDWHTDGAHRLLHVVLRGREIFHTFSEFSDSFPTVEYIEEHYERFSTGAQTLVLGPGDGVEFNGGLCQEVDFHRVIPFQFPRTAELYVPVE